MDIKELRSKARLLPAKPGVYLMRNKEGEIIYVGKAKILRNRVTSYFISDHKNSLKTAQLVSKIHDFDTIFAKNEFDALLLENTLIKKHKPRYNILLKDDKGFPYVFLPKEDYPRFTVVGKKGEAKGRYFGPFGSRKLAYSAINLINETFLLPSCTRVFPRDINKDRPCLMYHLKRCAGVCTGQVTVENYEKTLATAILLLEGKTSKLKEMFLNAMNEAAGREEFEKAAMYRDRLNALKKISNKRMVVGLGGTDADAVSFTILGTKACVTVLSYDEGSLVDKHFEFFDNYQAEDAPHVLESFVKQYYGNIGIGPRELILSHKIEDPHLIEEYLTALRGSTCRIFVPQKGEKARMISMSTENGKLELLADQNREQKTRKILDLLKETLKLEKTPNRIEAYDISNTAGVDPVGSMTVFSAAKPLKKAYKKFKIKEAKGGDDYGSMAEVIGRRLDRALAGDEGFLPLPDILLIDGGFGQVGVVKAEAQKRGLDIPIFGMVKDNHHRTRALVSVEGSEIGISATPAIFGFIGKIQEETHRFAIEYHRNVRSKSATTSVLDSIPGVGEKRRRKLMEEFKSIEGIKAASADELSKIVPKDVAQKIVEHFAKKEEQ